MSDDTLARTGTGVGAIVIGTTVITGWWLLLAAVLLVVLGALAIRIAFRPGRSVGDQ